MEKHCVLGWTDDLLKMCEVHIRMHQVMRQDNGEFYSAPSQYALFKRDAAKFVGLATTLGFYCTFWNVGYFSNVNNSEQELFEVEIKTPKTDDEGKKFYFIGSVSTATFDFDCCSFMGLYFQMRDFLKKHSDLGGHINLEY